MASQEQTITPTELPNSGTYSIKFGTKKTNPLQRDASSADINAALLAVGLNNLSAVGQMNMAGGITITLTGFGDQHQSTLVEVDTTALQKNAVIVAAPTIKDTIAGQKQIIRPVDIPNSGSYTIQLPTIPVTPPTGDIPFDATDKDINAALIRAGLDELIATGSMTNPTGISINFTGKYA